MKFTRRKFAVSLGSLAILSLIGYRKFKATLKPSLYPGKLIGASFSRGHQIRDPKFPLPTIQLSTDHLIIGGGVAGLSCGHHLKKNNIHEFIILDLEQNAGGNARSGTNSQGAYPQAAHYLPIPTNESKELKLFLKDIGVITEMDSTKTVYNEYYLCSDPVERLYINGRWQAGLEPDSGLTAEDKIIFERFFKLMHEFKLAKGSDNKKAFAIPIYRSSHDSEFIKYDKLTFKHFLTERGLRSEYLDWYVDYCCKDDYGVSSEQVSAWAGIHYFASRDGMGEGVVVGKNNLLTWPEGNDFLVKKLAESMSEQIITNHLVWQIQSADDGYQVYAYDFKQQKSVAIKCKKLVYAAPEFTAKQIVKIPEVQSLLSQKEYAPWMVANIEFSKRIPDSDIPLSWDNVSYYSKSLGYVVSDHQSLASHKLGTTISVYWPLAGEDTPKNARIKALKTTHREWCDMVVADITKLHPDMIPYITNIDISLFGHGMIIPHIGFMKTSKKLKRYKNFYFAHSDQSGISIFEEAFYQGFRVAKEIASGS